VIDSELNALAQACGFSLFRWQQQPDEDRAAASHVARDKTRRFREQHKGNQHFYESFHLAMISKCDG
jgi:hypothetical protein